jgi:hypothetical protein
MFIVTSQPYLSLAHLWAEDYFAPAGALKQLCYSLL